MIYYGKLESHLRHCTHSGEKFSDSIISALSSLIFNFADNLEELYPPWKSYNNVVFTPLSLRYRQIPVRVDLESIPDKENLAERLRDTPTKKSSFVDFMSSVVP